MYNSPYELDRPGRTKAGSGGENYAVAEDGNREPLYVVGKDVVPAGDRSRDLSRPEHGEHSAGAHSEGDIYAVARLFDEL